jgi:hypothetical protein
MPNGTVRSGFAPHTMRPKGKLFALLAVFAAIGLVTATGAFTSVQAQRTADVNVAGDGSALLQLTSENAKFASVNGDTNSNAGELTLTFDSINTDAETDLGAVFNVTNNGDDTVTVHIADGNDGESASFADTNDDVNFLKPNGDSLEGSGNQVSLDPGEGISVTVVIDIGDTSPGDLLDGEIVIVADQ